MRKLKFVLCGCGHRGVGLVRDNVTKFKNVEILAACDAGWIDKAETFCALLKEKFNIDAKAYNDHNLMFDELKPDCVLIATNWETHI